MDEKKNIAVFGTGTYYQRYKNDIWDIGNVVAFFDNDIGKIGKTLDGIEIYSPNDCKKIKCESIYLLSVHEQKMKEQLERLGICDCQIKMFDDFLMERPNINYNVFTNRQCDEGYDTVLVTYSLSLTGAPIVLLNAAIVLKRMGYRPVLLSNKDGKLKQTALKKGIPVIVEEYIDKIPDRFMYWIKKSKLSIINTLLYYERVKDIQLDDRKIIWWLHEGDDYFKNYLEEKRKYHVSPEIQVYGVGNVVCDAYKKYFDGEIGNLLYGLENEGMELAYDKQSNHKLICAVVGSIIYRKGQDIILEAIEKLSKDVLQQIEVWFVGGGVQSEFTDMIKEKSKEIPQIKILGELPRQQMKMVYEEIDVLLCPSRIDPMPVVAVEAMMKQKVCVVPENIGTARLIENGVNGFIIKENNSYSWMKMIEQLLYCKSDLLVVGKKSRELYDKYFSIKIFGENLSKIIKNDSRRDKND